MVHEGHHGGGKVPSFQCRPGLFDEALLSVGWMPAVPAKRRRRRRLHPRGGDRDVPHFPICGELGHRDRHRRRSWDSRCVSAELIRGRPTGRASKTEHRHHGDPAKTRHPPRFDRRRCGQGGDRFQRTGESPVPCGGRHRGYLPLLRQHLPQARRPFAWHPSHAPPHSARHRRTATSSSRSVRKREHPAKRRAGAAEADSPSLSGLSGLDSLCQGRCRAASTMSRPAHRPWSRSTTKCSCRSGPSRCWRPVQPRSRRHRCKRGAAPGAS
jgi:hypothetical protein